LILQPLIARGRRNEARAVSARRLGARVERRGVGRREPVPLAELAAASGLTARGRFDRENLHLPDGLAARRGVWAAQRNFADARIVERGNVPLPHDQVNDPNIRRSQRICWLGRIGQVGLVQISNVAIILTENTVNIQAPFANHQLARLVDSDLEPGIVDGHAAGTNHVARLELGTVLIDRPLFIPVGVHLHATLLHQHTAVVFLRIKRLPAKIAFHHRYSQEVRGADCRPPHIVLLTHISDSCIQAEA
jgi:hypothetical protein